MARLLLDTDILIDHLRGHDRLRSRGHQLCYSVITRAELFAGGAEASVRALLEPMDELIVNRDISERAGRLRRNFGIEMPDALIAATALEHGLTLVTRNARHFSAVKGLKTRTKV